jgi:hypothetical protein
MIFCNRLAVNVFQELNTGSVEVGKFNPRIIMILFYENWKKRENYLKNHLEPCDRTSV